MDQGLNWDLARALNGFAGHSALLDGVAAIVATDLVFLMLLVVVAWWFVPRPFVAHSVQLLVASATDSSFPSDHATAAFTMASTALLRGSRGRWALTVGALLVAIARVYVGAHYPADVIAGAALGFGWSLVFVRLDSWLASPYSWTIGIARRLRLG